MEIQKVSFGPKRYLALKKSISTDEITNKEMYQIGFKKIYGYIQAHGIKVVGPWAVLYFLWDQENKKAEIAFAFPVEGVNEVKDSELSLVDVPESKSALGVLKGSYNGLGDMHHGLIDYLKNNNLEYADFAVEEYVVDPMSGKSESELVTNIYYMYK